MTANIENYYSMNQHKSLSPCLFQISTSARRKRTIVPVTPFVPIHLDSSSASANRVTVVTEMNVQVNKRIFELYILPSCIYFVRELQLIAALIYYNH